MKTFLSKDPSKAIVEIKEHLYERLEILRTCLGPGYKQIGYMFDEVEIQMCNEILFLENLLDMIERS